MDVEDAGAARATRGGSAARFDPALANLRDYDELARVERMRFMAEAARYPTALWSSQGTHREAVDDHPARGTRIDGELRLTSTDGFGADRLLGTSRAEDLGRMLDGRVVATPWERRRVDYPRRDGLRVPLPGEVAWLGTDGRRPYRRGRITSIASAY